MKSVQGEKFLASVYRIWMLRYVDVPETVVKSLIKQMAGEKRAKYIPVVATVNGQCARTTLLPSGGGHYRMQFNATLRKAANADAGDAVSLQLSLDTESREIAVPTDLRDALRLHPKAGKAFRDAPPGYRRQILKWMAAAKGTVARQRRIEMVMDRMLERAVLGPSRGRKDKRRKEK